MIVDDDRSMVWKWVLLVLGWAPPRRFESLAEDLSEFSVCRPRRSARPAARLWCVAARRVPLRSFALLACLLPSPGTLTQNHSSQSSSTTSSSSSNDKQRTKVTVASKPARQRSLFIRAPSNSQPPATAPNRGRLPSRRFASSLPYPSSTSSSPALSHLCSFSFAARHQPAPSSTASSLDPRLHLHHYATARIYSCLRRPMPALTARPRRPMLGPRRHHPPLHLQRSSSSSSSARGGPRAAQTRMQRTSAFAQMEEEEEEERVPTAHRRQSRRLMRGCGEKRRPSECGVAKIAARRYQHAHHPAPARRLDVYVWDYLTRRGFTGAAKTLVSEAHMAEPPDVPLRTPQGLLFECAQTLVFAAYTHAYSHARILPAIRPRLQILGNLLGRLCRSIGSRNRRC